MLNVYVSIGNSDDKLTQKAWAMFISAVRNELRSYANRIHGEWYSRPDSIYQNACYAIEIDPDLAYDLRDGLISIAGRYNQDSIAWSECETVFISPH